VNALSGRVTSIEYQGSYVKITLDVGIGEPFVANVSDAAYFADPAKVGDQVSARWHTADVHLLDKVDHGMAGALYEE
jgi:putative spermidine/putrescine transport system ATP-binding protein